MEPRRSLYRNWTICWSWILIWNHTKEKSNDGKDERASLHRYWISSASRLSSLPDIKYFKAFSSSWKQKKRESIPSHLPISTMAFTWIVEPTKSKSKNGHLLHGRCTFEEISVRSHRHSLSRSTQSLFLHLLQIIGKKDSIHSPEIHGVCGLWLFHHSPMVLQLSNMAKQSKYDPSRHSSSS